MGILAYSAGYMDGNLTIGIHWMVLLSHSDGAFPSASLDWILLDPRWYFGSSSHSDWYLWILAVGKDSLDGNTVDVVWP